MSNAAAMNKAHGQREADSVDLRHRLRWPDRALYRQLVQ